ncbi:MAG: transposase family protein [Firmicutes bacterium]|nr:transposase family protein [Bacillota bacterium]
MWGFFRRLGLVVKQERSDPAEIILVVESSALGAACPLCGHFSDCRHSQYIRRLLDLPADGRKVVLHWRTRKFRCSNPNCRRRVFAERIPGLARPHAVGLSGSTNC